MATILPREDFEGAGNGASITTSTTSATSMSGSASFVHSTDWSISGSKSAKINAASTTKIITWDLSSRTDTYISFYFKSPTVDPSANAFFLQVMAGDGVTVAFQMGIETDGDIRVRDGLVTEATAAITTGGIYRADVTLLGAGGQTTRLYTGANLHSTNTANAAFTASGNLTATNFSLIQIGPIAAVAGGFTMYMDYLEASNSALPAPWTDPTPPATPESQTGNYIIKRRVGGAWILQKMRRRVVGATPAWPTFVFNRIGEAPTVDPGILVPSIGAWFGTSMDQGVDNFEAVTQNPVDIQHYYKVNGWDGVPTAAEKQAAVRTGKPRAILYYNYKPIKPYNHQAVAAGTYDSRIDTVAAGLKTYPYKVFLAFMHEPEDDTINKDTGAAVPQNSPTYFRAAFRRCVTRFRAAGVTNVVFVVNYMGYGKWGEIEDDIYPGDDVVDWIAYDPYAHGSDNTFADFGNTTTGRPAGSDWTGFYDWAAANHPTKPLMLGEWGIDFATVSSANQANICNTLVADLQSDFPNIKALVYWNQILDAADYRAASGSAAFKAAFKTLANNPYFNTVSTADMP